MIEQTVADNEKVAQTEVSRESKNKHRKGRYNKEPQGQQRTDTKTKFINEPNRRQVLIKPVFASSTTMTPAQTKFLAARESHDGRGNAEEADKEHGKGESRYQEKLH